MRTPWTNDEIKLLGTASDAEIAKQLGRSKQSVTKARSRRSIPDYSPRVYYPDSGDPIWQLSNQEIADKYGVKREQIIMARRARGIRSPAREIKCAVCRTAFTAAGPGMSQKRVCSAACRTEWSEKLRQSRAEKRNKRSSPTVWSEASDAVVRTATAQHAAETLGIPVRAVYRRRASLGLRDSDRADRKVWTPGEINLLGTTTDRELAKKMNRSVESVRHARRWRRIKSPRRIRWTPRKIKSLGTLPDAELAKKWGCQRNAVYKKRVSLRIESPQK